MRRVLLMFAVIIVGVAVILWVTAASASAATGPCPGTRRQHIPLTDAAEGTRVTLAYLNIYWDGASNRNCARVDLTRAFQNRGIYMRVNIFGCQSQRINPATGACEGAYGGEEDFGNFNYYAGPVFVRAPGRCIQVSAYVNWFSGGLSASHVTPPILCR